MRFRRQALRQLEAPEQLDEVARLAGVPTWLATAALTLVVVVAGTWSIAGTVTRSVRAAGVLIHSTGVSPLDATVSGQVTHVWAAPNQYVTKGTPLYSVQERAGNVDISVAPWDAYVVNWLIAEGAFIEPGSRVAQLERLDAPGDMLEAKVYAPASIAPQLSAGLSVEVQTAVAPAAVFGTLRGTVASVGSFPETEQSIHAFLGQDFQVAPLLADGNVIAVTVRLDTDPGSPSGLRWSKPGPPFRLTSLSQVTARFAVAREHPIRWLINK